MENQCPTTPTVKKTKKDYSREWNNSHREYFKEKVECKICHKMIKRSHISRHHKTGKCSKIYNEQRNKIITQTPWVDMSDIIE
jgi:uncharacterized C2H2 Zn-finger protein